MEDLKARVTAAEKTLDSLKAFTERNLDATSRVLTFYREKSQLRFSGIFGFFWLFWLIYAFIMLRKEGGLAWTACLMVFLFAVGKEAYRGFKAWRGMREIARGTDEQ